MVYEGLQYLAELYTKAFENKCFFALVGIILILLMTKFRKKETTKWLLICAVIVVLFINPIVAYVICEITEIDRYLRIFWTFPFTLFIAYAGTKLLEQSNKFPKTVLLVIMAAGIFLAGGKSMGTGFSMAPNLYKIPDGVTEIADKVQECRKGKEGEPYVLATNYLSTYLRQYDGSMKLLFGRSPEKDTKKYFKIMTKHQTEEIPYEELYELGQNVKNMGVNVIVLLKYQVQSEALEAVGYVRADETDDYYIFSL